MRNFFSLLGGLATGAVLGLLFAPQSGEETRAKISALIKEKMPEISKEKLEELVDQVIEKAKTMADNADNADNVEAEPVAE